MAIATTASIPNLRSGLAVMSMPLVCRSFSLLDCSTGSPPCLSERSSPTSAHPHFRSSSATGALSPDGRSRRSQAVASGGR